MQDIPYLYTLSLSTLYVTITFNTGQALFIMEHPQNHVKKYGDKLTLTVSAVGVGSLSYQWLKDGKAITKDWCSNCTGGDTHELVVSAFLPEHEGSYKCVVSTGNESVESRPADVRFGKYNSFLTKFLKSLLYVFLLSRWTYSSR